MPRVTVNLDSFVKSIETTTLSGEGEDGRERGEEKRGERGDGRRKSRERERSRPWMEKRAESDIGVERR
ncbi:hypothetical protein TNCV_2822591 [Trichonephila clavipes]|nr:hypothetical protein TNCV_2822591 [Trichonephila clavipes]